LMLAEHNGLRIHEVPVDWVDDPDSRVRIASTARDDLKGMWRLLRSFARGRGHLTEPVRAHRTTPRRGFGEQLVRFASIGVVSTIAFAVLFVLLVGPLGILGADIVALGLCTLANTAANRRLTFAVRGRTGRARQQARGLAVALIPLTLNVLALGALTAAGVVSVAAFVIALTLVNALGSFAKFTLLQSWVFRQS
jgi:putative flippase GtrA